jgi:D-alanine-D-alanine ligase-like ATP-grasp enzyme
MKKTRVGILFGGGSGEHEALLLSAASILAAIDRERYDVLPIAISKEGRWLAVDGDGIECARIDSQIGAGHPDGRERSAQAAPHR